MKIAMSGLLVGLSAMPLMAAMCEMPAQPGKLQGTFDASGEVCFQLPASGENYVSATLIAATDARLLNANNSLVRTLLKGGPADGQHSLLFSLPERESSALVLNGHEGNHWSLTWRIETATPLQNIVDVAPDSPRLQALAKTLASGGSTEAFWQERARVGAPLVEPFDTEHKRVTFLWRGARSNVFLVGSPEGDNEPLYHLANSDIWYRSYIVPSNTRLQYMLAPDVPHIDGSAWDKRRAILISAQADPLNPHRLGISETDSWNRFSLLDFNPTRYFSAEAMARPVRHGTLTHYQFYSERLGNSREIMIYRPRSAQAARWTLVLFDGQQWQKGYHTANVLDGLMARHVLPPVNLVFIDSLDPLRRNKELPPNPDFADFVALELSPWLRRQGIPLARNKTVLGGASFGGLAASWVALRFPRQFGNVLSLSGSYWWAPADEAAGWLTRQFQQTPRYPLRFWIGAGTLEQVGPRGGIYPYARDFEQALREKGYNPGFHTYASGHGYAAWLEALVDGLQDLTGKR